MSLLTEEIKAKAEMYYGDRVCRQKFSLLLAEIGLPDGLLTIQDIEECGYVKEEGFVWLKLEEKKEHKFDKHNIVVCYDTIVTAHVEPNKIKNLTGVKAKDFLLWFTLTEIHVKGEEGSQQGPVITFKSLVGLSMSFPVSLFMAGNEAIEEAKQDKWWRMIKL
ncbi:hypothetical protein HN51_004232 [Arachis hypogaea]|uniref:Uncharacterized protein n=3 Tax=Arachis TaxID=3817 RepID=A0A444WP64_ARAHY|nr:uncharacterized protein LOC107483383 [Arachis duranensis]XP_025692093.1 uncharacterized protein LOC112794203 [Arachis hypogaea]QHO37790.1 uncharacterized protein DS421_4g114640 [Arachis hypogaea]RYQ79306.1 hypothetical protein Ahy_Scaffold6g108027 isoform A [Arachis hypogaea]